MDSMTTLSERIYELVHTGQKKTNSYLDFSPQRQGQARAAASKIAPVSLVGSRGDIASATNLPVAAHHCQKGVRLFRKIHAASMKKHRGRAEDWTIEPASRRQR